MQINEATLDHLNRCTVAIQKAESNSVLGTGVIVTDDGLIVTCYHVVGNIKAKTLDKTVDIYFPSAPEIKGQADVLEEYSDSSLDIAFLQLQEKELLNQVSVANLSETIDPTHTFRSFGFRKEKTFDGLYSDGTIQGKVRKKFKADGNNDNNILLQDVIQLKSDGIDHGMSGAAVLDIQINRVIGIVSEYLATSSNIDKNFALAIPIESIIQVCPELKQKNQGLKILEFLRKIGAEEIEKYHKINYLFVPPTEYEDIKDKLQKSRMVFITGTKEYGKTYTAIRLLWEYFNQGYEPKWFSIEQEMEENKIRNRMLNIKNLLRKHSIIYFDDPFGKTKYESNEVLERSINEIIEVVENTEDVYIIITSREEIFKEFVRIVGFNPKGLEVKMNINTPSYNYEKRKEMLLKWAEAYDCKWLLDQALKSRVFEIIVDRGKLPTSLNIREFAYASQNINSENDLLQKIYEKSQKTAWSFAKEIESMSNDKVLFLSFPFISDWLQASLVKEMYEELIDKLRIETAWNFNRIIEHFKADKIDVNSGYIRFSHPSYSEAIKYIISNSYTAKSAKILSSVLLTLTDRNYYGPVARIITSNYDKLPLEVTNLLFRFIYNKYASGYVARYVAANFDKLPPNVKNILNELANSNEGARAVAYAVYNNFEKLPDDVKNELLYKLADSKKAADVVSETISLNFDKLSENVRNELLLKLVDSEFAIRYVASAVAANFDKLPSDVRNELLLKLADNKETAGAVAEATYYNFDKLSDPGGFAIRYVAHEVAANFDKLSENVRNELLLKLADSEFAASAVASAVAANFDKLSENVRNELLLKLADKLSSDVRNNLLDDTEFAEDVASGVANAVASAVAANFDKLPSDVRNELLLKLVDTGFAIRYVAHEVAANFDKLPSDVRNELLLKLVDSEFAGNVASAVASAVAANFDKLPDNVRNELLLKLVDSKKAAGDIDDIVKKNHDKIPENVRNEILRKLSNTRENANGTNSYG